MESTRMSELRPLCDNIVEKLATQDRVEVDLTTIRDIGCTMPEFQSMLRATIEYDYALSSTDLIEAWHWPSTAFGTLILRRNKRLTDEILAKYRRHQDECG